MWQRSAGNYVGLITHHTTAVSGRYCLRQKQNGSCFESVFRRTCSANVRSEHRPIQCIYIHTLSHTTTDR